MDAGSAKAHSEERTFANGDHGPQKPTGEENVPPETRDRRQRSQKQPQTRHSSLCIFEYRFRESNSCPPRNHRTGLRGEAGNGNFDNGDRREKAANLLAETEVRDRAGTLKAPIPAQQARGARTKFEPLRLGGGGCSQPKPVSWGVSLLTGKNTGNFGDIATWHTYGD